MFRLTILKFFIYSIYGITIMCAQARSIAISITFSYSSLKQFTKFSTIEETQAISKYKY